MGEMARKNEGERGRKERGRRGRVGVLCTLMARALASIFIVFVPICPILASSGTRALRAPRRAAAPVAAAVSSEPEPSLLHSTWADDSDENESTAGAVASNFRGRSKSLQLRLQRPNRPS